MHLNFSKLVEHWGWGRQQAAVSHCHAILQRNVFLLCQTFILLVFIANKFGGKRDEMHNFLMVVVSRTKKEFYLEAMKILYWSRDTEMREAKKNLTFSFSMKIFRRDSRRTQHGRSACRSHSTRWKTDQQPGKNTIILVNYHRKKTLEP